MAPPLLQLRNIALTFGGTPLLTDAELSVSERERVCLVGRNGSGKSTLLKIAAGLIEIDKGEIFRQPGASLRYLPQEPDFTGFATTLAYVEAGLGPHDDPHAARYMLERLGLTGGEDCTQLSGGEARRASLARAMASNPDILLLDEPTNHLDITTIEWLEQELASLRSAIVMISHDRRFLANMSRVTVWLDRGATRRMERGFQHFEEWRDEILENEEREQHKLERKIAAEEHWIRYGVTARRKRNMRRVAELNALRERRKGMRRSQGNVDITASGAERSGALVIEAKHISKAYGERDIVRDFSTIIERGDRIGIVGPNGSGKTTLISMLTGGLAPDNGSLRIGKTVQMAQLTQNRDSLDPKMTVSDALTGGHGTTVSVNGRNRHVIGYLKDFLFTPDQTKSPISILSGGERGRLLLSIALAKESNLLVLDEPTNDLDMETLDVLEEMLVDYPGTILLISHDRDFLDRLVAGTIVPEGRGRWAEYAGGYSDMLSQRGADLTREAPKKEKKETPVPVKAEPAASKKRMSFKDKHALETLPQQIADMQNKAKALAAKLDDPQLYVRDRAAFETATAELGQLQHDIEAAEERWLALEMEREGLGER
ncbi:MAG TPA: ATP-binding cassette domain-containing protein [Pseudolabrys sp.]|nr:ATP-binding cassette domain-containing protein [Pseudolabrys sp.]